MEKILWHDHMSVGVQRMDEQHRQVLEMLNCMIDEHNAPVQSEAVSDTLTRMTAHAKDHFKAEEQLLSEHGYPRLEAHREQHKIFIRKTADLCLNAMSHERNVPAELLSFLITWWVDHILTTDMLYKPFLNQAGVH